MAIIRLPSVDIHAIRLPAIGDVGDNAPNLVFVHGLATSLGFWLAGSANIFRRFGNVMLFDLRGHGRSTMPPSGYSAADMADDLDQLLDRFDMDRVHLIAHSFGGAVALTYASQRPSRVVSMVLADVRVPGAQAAVVLNNWAGWPAFRGRLAQAGIEIDADDSEGGLAIVTAMVRQYAAQKGQKSSTLDAIMPGSQRLLGPRTARKWLRLIDTTSARGEIIASLQRDLAALTTLNMPILGLYGELSMMLKSLAVLEQQCPNFRSRVIPGAGHFFPSTRPREFARHASRFLARQTLR